MLFNDIDSVVRVIVVGGLAYAALVILLRISGRRTLSKMNAFDFVVTIALGSTLATVLLSKEVALVDGVVAFALLIGLQYAVTWTSVRVHWVQQAVTGEPILLLYQGEMLFAAMRKARVTDNEVQAAVRSAGLVSFHDVDAVVLETDGSFSVLRSNASNANESKATTAEGGEP